MRIISMIVMLPIVWVTFIPGRAMAAPIVDTNETKINFKIQDNIKVTDGIAPADSDIRIPFNYKGYAPVRKKEDDRDKFLAKFAGRSEDIILPEGKFAIDASAYTAAADECGKNDGITASGLRVMENRTIACPPRFPFGTKIRIDGYGTFVCEDRGGAIKGNHVDIYMPTKAQAFAFGRKTLSAEIVD